MFLRARVFIENLEHLFFGYLVTPALRGGDGGGVPSDLGVPSVLKECPPIRRSALQFQGVPSNPKECPPIPNTPKLVLQSQQLEQR